MDFSGASLRLSAEGEDKVTAALDRIDKKAQQVGAEASEALTTIFGHTVQQAVAAFDGSATKLYTKLSDYEKAVSAEHMARMRQEAETDRQYGVELNQRIAEKRAAEEAYERGAIAEHLFRIKEQTAADRAQQTSADQTAVRFLAISRAIEMMGRTGHETGRALDTLLAQVGYLAFGFGAKGAIVGAVAITTAAIVEMFNRVARENEKARASMLKTLEDIGHAHSAIRADEEATQLFSGDPFAIRGSAGHENETDVQFMARSKGILALRDRLRELNAELVKIPHSEASAFGNLGTGSSGTTVSPAAQKRIDEIKEITDQLKVVGEGYARATELRARFMKTEEDAARIALEKKTDRFDERSVAEFQNAELNRIVERIKASHELTPALINEHNEVIALRNEQQLLRYELDAGNLSAQQRIDKERQLAQVTKDLDKTSESSVFMNGHTVHLPAPKVDSTKGLDDEQIAAIKKAAEKMKQEADRVANEIGQTLANGVTAGIRSGFSGGGIGGAFKAMTAAILDGLGEMFAKVAEKALIGSTLMKSLVSAIQNVNPWVAAAAAVALLAFGNSIRSSGSSGGGYSGGYGGGSGGGLPSIVTTGVATASAPNGPVTNPSHITARPSNQYQVFVIGKDAKAWRQVQQQLDENARRG